MPRHPKPQALIEYEAWLAKGPPRFCYNCDHYGGEGQCFAFNVQVPLEFTQKQDSCPTWAQEIPF
jgi:ABC-type uncharacterized transport system YnjBCD substrate-binding protein